jgi:uncharacterized membrane protein YphA (DoxX/SURF4 family)
MSAGISPDVAPGAPPTSSRASNRVAMIARILMGLMFFVFGLNGFLHFIPQPKNAMPEAAMSFFGAMMATKYFTPMIFATQFVSGVLLLANRFVPLALALLAPVIVNIILFHVFLDPAGIPPGIVVAALEVYLAWTYRGAFRPMLAARAEVG